MEPQSTRILVVDDEKAVRSLVAAVLTKAGYTVCQAADALQAIDACNSETYDLLLSDVRMPGMNGHLLVQWVAAEHPGTRTALMTGFDSECLGCPSSPRCRVIEKPFRASDLLAFVRFALSSPAQSNLPGCP
jgi:DNA-binding NtrC family response regulator